MWCSFKLLCLLLLMRAGAPQESSMAPTSMPPSSEGTTAPDGDGTVTPHPDNNNSMCINPTDIVVEERTKVEVKFIMSNFQKMRDIPSLMHPALGPACGFRKLEWDELLAKVSQEMALLCPMRGEPYIPMFERGPEITGGQRLGHVLIYGIDLDKFAMTAVEPWSNFNIMKELPDNEARRLGGLYTEGPWDPFYQILWSNTSKVGCVMTLYNNSDTAAMSKMFKREIKETMELWNIVCTFAPDGSVVGMESFKFCGLTETETTKQTGLISTHPIITNPVYPSKTTRRTTRQVHGAGIRIGQGIGFNFETLTILISALLSRDLVR